MKSQATLIKKEKLRNNYKLTFNNGNKDFFLILHEKRKKIFHQLISNRKYSFNWIKGKRYSFLCPFSIELSKQTLQNSTKDIFIKQLSAELGLKKLSTDNLSSRLFKLTKELTKNDTATQFIKLLFLKHQNSLNTPLKLLTENEQKEIKLLNDLKYLFLVDMMSVKINYYGKFPQS